MAISFKNPQLQKLAETPESRTYTVAVTTVVLVVLLLFFAIRPSVSSVFDRLNQNEDKRDYINRLEQKQQNLVTLTAKETDQEEELDLLDQAFPEARKEEEVADLIINLVDANSLEFHSLDHKEAEDQSNIEDVIGTNVRYANMTLRVSGPRTSVWALVEDMESLNRIFNITKVGLSSRIDEDGSLSKTYDADIAFYFYYYKKSDV
ncbi:hypothetical protein GF389_03330 [Candidatus Dojkabacteria bacterium]|nr:hypothetical protein [Candidatus Dojkabacteria bacterium]